MQCRFAALAATTLLALGLPAHAQTPAARLDAWLCEYFSAPSDDLLARFPDYGLGPVARTTTPRTDARGNAVETSSATVHGQSITVTTRHHERVALKRTYGYELKIEAKGQPIWSTAKEAEQRLARVGKVRTDKTLDETVAEAGREPGGAYYNFTATFSTEFQRLEIQWQQPQDASYGKGFCS